MWKLLILFVAVVYANNTTCVNGIENNGHCVCSKGYLTVDKTTECDYWQKNKAVAFLLSFWTGITGLEYFYLARGNTAYIVLGIVKMTLLLIGTIAGIIVTVVLGGDDEAILIGRCVRAPFALAVSLWWLIDWIWVLANAFPDGNGQELFRVDGSLF